MIYQTVNFPDFQAAFNKMGRGDQFSLKGLRMLYDWLEETYSGEYFELDVIDLCCYFAEYTKEEFLNYYNIDGVDCIDSLEQAILDGDIDCVIAYHLGEDVILVNSN